MNVCSTAAAADGAAIAVIVELEIATMLVATSGLLVNAPPFKRLLQPREAAVDRCLCLKLFLYSETLARLFGKGSSSSPKEVQNENDYNKYMHFRNDARYLGPPPPLTRS